MRSSAEGTLSEVACEGGAVRGRPSLSASESSCCEWPLEIVGDGET